MDKYSSKVCISSSPFSMFPYFDLRRAVTGSYSRGKNCNKSKKTTVYGESFYYSVHDAYAAMLNTLYSGMSGRGASLNSSMLHLVSCWDVET